MKETTVYESEDGRRFESADDCLQWERTLAQIRKIRQKLWDMKAHHMQWVDMHDSKCTDESDLYDPRGEKEVEGELALRFGNLRGVIPVEAVAYLDRIKRTYEIAFGD